jgi:hypothetical protein
LPASQKHNKPLFHEKTLTKAINAFSFPAGLPDKHVILNKWIATCRRGTLDAVTETSLNGEFLGDLLATILGFRTVVGGVLGLFSTTEAKRGKIKLVGRVVAPIELKGAKVNLDRRPSRSLESPAQTAQNLKEDLLGFMQAAWILPFGDNPD